MRPSGLILLSLFVLIALGVGLGAAVGSSRGGGDAAVTTQAGPEPSPPAVPTPEAGASPPSSVIAPRVAPTVRRSLRRTPRRRQNGPITAFAPPGGWTSRPVGRANDGRLKGGVLFPEQTRDTVTWDAIEQRSPNRDWRRVGTDRLVWTIQRVAADVRRANPGMPRVVVSDLSLPQGGSFGPEYGGMGHASHQNGLDVDIAYPRIDRIERGVERVGQVDRRLAQALVNGFVTAGAQFVFVGRTVGLTGPERVVQRVANHDDHLHVRLPRLP